MISKTKGLDLGKETVEDLELLMHCELYRDIDSPFAKEIDEEIERRGEESRKREQRSHPEPNV